MLDFGASSVAGDRRFDELASATYLSEHSAVAADRDLARAWLRNRGLDEWFEPFRRWAAGYWSFAVDDARPLEWCERVLR